MTKTPNTTPAPWTIHEGQDYLEVRHEGKIEDRIVYIVRYSGDDDRANAALICAVHDLAEACQKILFQAPRISPLIDSQSDRDWFNASCNDARAALAKAGVK